MNFVTILRLLWVLPLIICIVNLTVYVRSSMKVPTVVPPNDVEILLEELFDSSTALDDIQICWNKLLIIWKKLLLKFLDDACDLCHKDDPQCTKTLDIDRYITAVNKTFFPINKAKRPIGMGLYYDFDLKTMRSLNNPSLPTDVNPCDYFHMFQLMINVQIVLHEKQIDYFITKGTFIGALRHHDVIPWDTDIDLFIPISSASTFKSSFKRLNIKTDKDDGKSGVAIYPKDLVVYQFRNAFGVTSYKIFSTRSSRVNRAHYHWPKIDVFPYEESRTHVFAFPHHRHNFGTMSHLAKTDLEPTVLRPLGPLLVPSPRNLRPALNAMVRLGKSNVFYVCQGNTFLHRLNQASTETWRVACKSLSGSYPFVKSSRDSSTGLCTEALIFNNKKKGLSLYKCKCQEHLVRTFRG